MEFTADQVWALAACADRLNGGYLKEPVYDFNVDQKNPVKVANKQLVKQWLREGANPATESDYAAGRSYRSHFNSYTLLALSGQLNDFQKQAMKVAAMDTFTGRNMLEFAIISCLPATARRDQERTEFKRELFTAPQLAAAVGETIVGDIDVLSCSYSTIYNKFRVKARLNESHVAFWYKDKVEGTMRIKAKVKEHCGDNTTKVHYVKRVG